MGDAAIVETHDQIIPARQFIRRRFAYEKCGLLPLAIGGFDFDIFGLPSADRRGGPILSIAVVAPTDQVPNPANKLTQCRQRVVGPKSLAPGTRRLGSSDRAQSIREISSARQSNWAMVPLT